MTAEVWSSEDHRGGTPPLLSNIVTREGKTHNDLEAYSASSRQPPCVGGS